MTPVSAEFSVARGCSWQGGPEYKWHHAPTCENRCPQARRCGREFFFWVDLVSQFQMARSFLILAASLGLVGATGCPYGHTSAHSEQETLEKRVAPEAAPPKFLQQFTVNDTDSYLTSDVGGPIEDQNSLKGLISSTSRV